MRFFKLLFLLVPLCSASLHGQDLPEAYGSRSRLVNDYTGLLTEQEHDDPEQQAADL